MLNNIKRFILIGLSCFIGSALADTPSKYNNVIIFGDSLSDVGNNYWVLSGTTGTPITNQDEKRKRPLWDNDLVRLLFPAKQLYKSSDMTSHNLNLYTDNISYAWGSAETGAGYLDDTGEKSVNNDHCTQSGYACVPGVRKQIELYFADLSVANKKPNPKTLFIIWAGGNDIFNHFGDAEYGAPAAILNLKLAKNDLIAGGVLPKQIYVINFPDFSKAPSLRKMFPDDTATLTRLHNFSLMINAILGATLTLNESPSQPGILLTHIFSIEKLLNEIIDAPETFDFDKNKITNSCLEDGASPVCKGYLFFDGKHPTVKVGQIIAERFKKNLEEA